MSRVLEEHLYFNAFNQIPQLGAVRFQRLWNFFPDLKTAWAASAAELLQSGLDEDVVGKISEIRQSIDPDQEMERLETHEVRLITIRDAEYPKILREIPNPPAAIYVKGDYNARDQTAIAVVGSRKFSAYGRQVAEELSGDLARAGLTIVSGLALGIDSFAHGVAVENGGRTVAVLGCGLDNIYPVHNRLLAEKILDGHGAVISEFCLGTPPLKHHFPFRNRIISGLSLGVVVVEAAADSGALITASHALEQNRQVYAVPGSIFNLASQGPNNLLKMGAKPITSYTDILEDLNLEEVTRKAEMREILGDTPDEQKILDYLSREARHFDLISKELAIPAAILAATLTILEMKGRIRNLGGNQYVRTRKMSN